MRLYSRQIMMNKFANDDIVGAKQEIIKHFSEYIFTAIGYGAEVGSAVPEVSVYGNSFPEIKLVSEKKEYPIVFRHKDSLFNLIGINENYGYFLKMDDRLAEPTEIAVVPFIEKLSITTAISRYINTLLNKNKHPSVSPVSDKVKERVVSNGIVHDFKITKYWFRKDFTSILKSLHTSYNDIVIDDLVTYRLLNGQGKCGLSIPLFVSNETDTESYSIGKRDEFEAYGIPFSDMEIGALYSITELTAKERMVR